MWILFVLSVLPSIVLLGYIWHKDKIEKEPVGLLVSLFILGALMIVPAALGEVGLIKALGEALSEESTAFIAIENFLIVALLEEGCKFLVLRLRTWRNPNFNYTFDAVVYSVCVSLGFATVENILYVVDNGTFQVAVMRGLLSVPGHAIDAVFMGWLYGLAKRCECIGDLKGKSKYIRLSLGVPILTHGFYDFCLSCGEDSFIAVFFVFEITVTIVAIRKVRELSANDTVLLPTGMPFGGYVQYQQYYQEPGYQQYYQQNYQDPRYQQYYQQYQQYQQQYQQYQQNYQQQDRQAQQQYQQYQQQYQQYWQQYRQYQQDPRYQQYRDQLYRQYQDPGYQQYRQSDDRRQ